jgi:hypothetical protein
MIEFDEQLSHVYFAAASLVLQRYALLKLPKRLDDML